MIENTEKFKGALSEELNTLEGELKTIGRINPSNPNDWEPIPGDIKTGGADKNERLYYRDSQRKDFLDTDF